MYLSLYRRYLLLTAVALSLVSFDKPLFANTVSTKLTSFQEKLAKLEASAAGRIGLSALNTENKLRLQYHADERFPMGCTSKVMGVAAILKQSMSDNQLLQQKITYTQADLLSWAPVTKQHLAEGMTVEQLSAAAMMQSDNTAMNLLVKKLGGLDAINNFAHSIGNHSFRQDRGWPDEALTIPGELLDTATPASMEKSLQHLALGNVLAAPQRQQLQYWLKNNTTGDAKIRAGVPKGWTVGDKTGAGFYYGITNDIGIIWPPNCAPIVVAIYFNQAKKDAAKRADIIASATRIMLDEFAQTSQCLKSAMADSSSISPPKQSSNEPKPEVLQRFVLPETKYKTCGMGIATFNPNAEKSLHAHSGPEVGYVLEGEISIIVAGQAIKTFKAGQSFQIPPHVLHRTKAGLKGAKIIATWVME